MDIRNRARTVLRFEHLLPFPAQAVFPLLCPVREYDWIEPWKCEMIHSASGLIEPGCVFATAFPERGAPEVWVCSEHEPDRLVRFVRVNADRTVRFTIRLDLRPGGVLLGVEQEYTALTEAGEARDLPGAAARFPGEMALLMKMLEHYLRTGTMLRAGEEGKD